MKLSPAILYPLFSILAFSLCSCGPSRREEPFTQPLRAADDDNTTIQRGQIAFMRTCNQCHPGGAAGLGPAINNKPIPAWLLKTQTRVGLGEMPSFGKHEVPPEDATAIATYLKSLRSLKEKRS